MIEFKKVTKYFKKNKVLIDISFDIRKGEFVILSGINGSGKTTIINLINQVVTLKSKDKGKIKSTRSISYFPEKIVLPTYIKGYDFLKLFLDEHLSKGEIEKYMEKYKIPNKAVNLYSKGMIQKLIIIKTLLMEKELYIFDEPINGLDVDMKKIFIEDLKHLKIRNKTVLVCSHEKKLFSKLCDKEIIIENGIICS